MMYNFSFEKKRLLLLVTGLMLVGVLTFVGGMVAGIAMWTPSHEEIALLKSKGVAAPAVATGGLTPVRPALPATPTAPELPAMAISAAGKAHEKAATPAPAEAAAAAPAPTAETAAPKPAAPTAGGEAAPEPAALSHTSVLAVSRGPFCLQLGSFEKQEFARKLQSDLKDKGYTATIFELTDADQRTWHAVRIGGFDSLDSASRAAADFSSKERIQALVRKSDAL